MLLWPGDSVKSEDTDTTAPIIQNILGHAGRQEWRGRGVSFQLSGGRIAMPSQVISRRAREQLNLVIGRVSYNLNSRARGKKG